MSIIKANGWAGLDGLTRSTVIQTVYGDGPTQVALGTGTYNYFDYMSVTITPRFANSKILLLVKNSYDIGSGYYSCVYIRTNRTIGGVRSPIYTDSLVGYRGNAQFHIIASHPQVFYDTPGTTSPVTYTWDAANGSGSTPSGNYDGRMNAYLGSRVILMEIAQ
jgi:hypothetical protein